MKLLMITPQVSNDEYSILQKRYNLCNPGQKFYSLLYSGLVENGVDVKVFSVVPEEWKPFLSDRAITYFYKPKGGIKLSFVKKASEVVSKYISDDTIIIADGEAYWTLVIALKQKCKVINLITDFPHHVASYSDSINKRNWMFRLLYHYYALYKLSLFKKADGFILLTEYMADVVGRCKPYIVIEGFSDSHYNAKIKKTKTNGEKVISYLGALNNKSGILQLIEAVEISPDLDIRLEIYGQGSFASMIEQSQDSRICYKGIIPLDEVERVERASDFLVNPRPSKEEYNKYSFPSKTLEYMISGTPVISTILEGIPKDYYNYLFVLDDSSVNSMAESLRDILNIPEYQLTMRGRDAQEFAMKEKSNIQQATRIINFITEDIMK